MQELKLTQIIKKDSIINKSKIVYDLNVEDDNSYNIEKLIVHNSGSSSLIAHILGIHRINPLDKRWGDMPFERFLSLGKLSNKIIIYDDKNNKKEFISQDIIKVIRNKKELEIEAKDLKENDEFIDVIKRFTI